MATLKVILTVIFVIVCIALTIIVLMQEGKSAGLGAISGAAETYWGRNKGRSMEGALEKITRWLVVGFIVISIILIPISSKAEKTNSSNTNTTNQNTTTNNNDTDSGTNASEGAATASDGAVDEGGNTTGDAAGSEAEE